MDIKQIKSIWAAWQEVQEKKAPVTKKDDDGEGMDPVGKADADIDNDGDTDSSDKYLAKRRKAIGKAMKKEAVEEDKSQFMYAAKQAKKKGDQQFVFAGKKYKTEDAYNMKEEDYPVPPKTKKPGDAMEPVNNRTAKLKESELFSAEELAALEEKSQPDQSGTPAEPFMSKNSASEKKVMASHKAGSDKHIEELDKVEDADIVKAGKAVKSQSPARNAADNLSVGDNAMKTPAKAKGQ